MRCSIESSKLLPGLVSVAVFLFYALMLSVPKGYSFGAGLLLVLAIFHMARGPWGPFGREDKILMGLLTAVFMAALISWLYHENEWASLDLSTRYLATVPVILLLHAYPPKQRWLWAGMIVGCLSAAGVATWQMQVVGLRRADGFTGGIQFGDLALMMAIYCAVGLAWAFRLHKSSGKWRLLLIAGALAGIYVSIMSGSRGGWVSLPLVVLVFCAAFLRRSNIRQALLAFVILAIGVAAATSTIPMLKKRYDEALMDVQQFQHGNPDSSLGLRFAMWESLRYVIPEKPFLGWSDQDFQARQEVLVKEGKMPNVVNELANTHNTFLEVWVHQGILGLIPLLALLAYCLYLFGRYLRCDHPLVQLYATAGFTLTVCYVIFGQTQIILGRNNTLLFFLITLAITWSALRTCLQARHERSPLARTEADVAIEAERECGNN